jgi:hypothetical protein
MLAVDSLDTGVASPDLGDVVVPAACGGSRRLWRGVHAPLGTLCLIA